MTCGISGGGRSQGRDARRFPCWFTWLDFVLLHCRKPFPPKGNKAYAAAQALIYGTNLELAQTVDTLRVEHLVGLLEAVRHF